MFLATSLFLYTGMSILSLGNKRQRFNIEIYIIKIHLNPHFELFDISKIPILGENQVPRPYLLQPFVLSRRDGARHAAAFQRVAFGAPACPGGPSAQSSEW